MSVEYKSKKYTARIDERSKRLTINIRYRDMTDITEIKGLGELRNLQELDLGYNKITEIKGLDSLTNLQVLNLYKNEILGIKGLEQLTNLEILQLGINQIKEIKGLENLVKLKNLFLGENQISEIKGLENLINLRILSLSNNKITEIKGLENLTNLEVLTLDSNQIAEIKGLDKLIRLRTLQLHENQISEIKGLENLTNLRELWLSDNKIIEIKGFENLYNLKQIWFENNQVTELKGLENLKNLISLDLRNNKITEIKGLANLEKLQWLDLYKNPVYKWTVKKFGDSDYRVLEDHHLPYVIAYCKEIDEKRKKVTEPSVIDTTALQKFLMQQLVTKINEKFENDRWEHFEAKSPPIGYITLKKIEPWLWVKSRVNYRGARWNPSTDRVLGDRYEAHAWCDWIGFIDTAPTKVSSPEELDEWAILITTYFREYRDWGDWGNHKGSWISDFQADGTVTIRVAEGVFHDISPEKATTIEQKNLRKNG